MELEHMRLERDPATGIATLILDYPEKMNMITMRARGQIRELFEQLDRDPQVRVIVIRGANGQFGSGGDIPGFMRVSPPELSNLHDNIAAPERCSKPVIAAVDGYCFGVAFEISLACDYILATKRSTFALPEIKLGMIPGSGGSQRLARMIGPMRARWMVMTGRRIPAAQAEAWGFISKAVEDGQLDAELKALTDELLALSPLALRVLKKTINAGVDGSLESALSLEGFAYGMLRSTEDFAEGVSAFVDKRKPRFQGR